MPTPLPPDFRLGVIEPREAVAIFRRRKDLFVSYNWQDLWQQQHSAAFTVSRLTRTDLLEAIRTELDRALAEGRTLKQFSDEIRPRLARAGWWGVKEVVNPDTGEIVRTRFNPARLQLIFDTNLRQSYAAGRWQRIERNKATNPYIIYRTMRDERVRASHRPWNGLALPVDHPFWDTHYPPNGWSCRCTAYATDAQGLDELRAAGLPVITDAPKVRMVDFINRSTGQAMKVPAGIDPGFAYNPGKSADLRRAQQVMEKTARVDPVAGSLAQREIWGADPAARQAHAQNFAAFVDEIAAAVAAGHVRSRGQFRFAGALSPSTLRALERAGTPVASNAITLPDRALAHALRDAKSNPLPLDVWRTLPDRIGAPQAVLRSPRDGKLLLVFDIAGDRANKLVIQVDAWRTRQGPDGREAVLTNEIVTGTRVPLASLRNRADYELVDGILDEG